MNKLFNRAQALVAMGYFKEAICYYEKLSIHTQGDGLEESMRRSIRFCIEQIRKGHQKDPMVSILMLTYNHAKYVNMAIESVLRQSHSYSYELVIIDDCSIDGTQDILRSFAGNPRIKLILREENKGIQQGVADAYSNARGDFIFINDGDDFWTSKYKIQKQVEHLIDNPNAALSFHYCLNFENRPNIGGNPSYEMHPKDIELSVNNFTFERLCAGNFINSNTVAYRKIDYSHLISLLMGREFAPWDWFIHLLHAQNGEIVFLPECLSAYRVGSQGSWGALSSNKLVEKYGLSQLLFFKHCLQSFNVNKKIRDLWLNAIEHLSRTLFFQAFEKSDYHRLDSLLKQSKLPYDRFCIEFTGFHCDNAERFVKSLSVATIVLTYNHETTIEQAILSVLSQRGLFTHTIIIYDDCSTDSTYDRIIELLNRTSLSSQDISVKVVRRDFNVGLSRNLNMALQDVTSYDFVAMCEGDDYWLGDDRLSKMLSKLLLYPRAGFAFSKILIEDIDCGKLYPHTLQKKLNAGEICLDDLIKHDITANFSCCVYRVSSLGFIPPQFWVLNQANWVFNLLLLSRCGAIHVDDYLSVYRVHNNGLWSSLSLGQKRHAVEYCRKIFYFLDKECRETAHNCSVMHMPMLGSNRISRAHLHAIAIGWKSEFMSFYILFSLEFQGSFAAGGFTESFRSAIVFAGSARRQGNEYKIICEIPYSVKPCVSRSKSEASLLLESIISLPAAIVNDISEDEYLFLRLYAGSSGRGENQQCVEWIALDRPSYSTGSQIFFTQIGPQEHFVGT